MKVIRKAGEMTSLAENLPEKSIGFVPTMGALHNGHLSLVEKSSSENDLTVVSIFVNPTQFNDPKDFDRYPREVDQDLELLKAADVDYVFLPSKDEIYPEKDEHHYELGEVSHVMEGAFRPGHFNGVASVVKRLFEIVQPKRAYFGLKDFQQFRIITELNKNYNLGVEVIGCDTVRDEDGLALSSRNMLLSKKERNLALHLSKTLQLMSENSTSMNHLELENLGKRYLTNFPELELEYVKVVDPRSFEPPSDHATQGDRIALLAAKIGKVRLIDNMKI
ncbi:pantoate--beta-alanine ligase [Cryomorphaceae bacterium 1068]|nr:pantoate--beta-alanine ligase [Cryomorphaceae bacterium 1068]